ncbi:Metalloenzyme, LuxS/M16 peptidase-like protein [Butyriboletus roseoflavus]|nr:Metalloenzyme, LuxS/M16 peptidase-like protein [Butyriboletus roseoflavus]
MATSDWIPIPQHGSIPPYSVFTKSIEKSHLDQRQYRLIRLDNNLTAILVHDPHAENAAASLDVAVGHLSDPVDMPGLAHFCEHLLFMGTHQFPKENEYSEYLSKNNGGSNAYTSSSNTNYHFHVSPAALSGAIERFAGFFHSPLFAPSCTTRELNAVDSEHKKNHQADPWRIFQLNKTLTKHGHPWNKFGTGNRDTLTAAGRDAKAKGNLLTNGNARNHLDVTSAPTISSVSPRLPSPTPSSSSASSEAEPDGGTVGRETRRRLVEWWSEEYCASRMNVCVIGRESLDELSDMVSRHFSPVLKLRQDSPPIIHDHPFGPNEMGTLVRVQTIMSFHAVELSFPLAWPPSFWKYKPEHLLSHFLGHEGPGSLHSYLKGKGWITSLNAAPQTLGRGFAMFKTTMYLTREGFDNYRFVVLATFKYLSLLRSSEIVPWYQSEVATISRTRFEFAEKRAAEAYATSIAEKMSWPVPTENTLSAPVLISEWENEAGLQEKNTSAVSGELQWQIEKWYGTGYTVERWDSKFLAQAQGPNDIQELRLPSRNEFIPTNLEVEKREVSEPQRRPHLIHETEISQVWHKKDDQFWLPKASVVIEIRSPIANDTPRASVLTRLFSDLVNDSLTEYTYDADLAGLAYNLGAHSLGVAISLKGYNDKLPDLARRIVEALRNLQIRQDRLELTKEKLIRQWESFFMSQSYQLSDYYTRHILTHGAWTVEEQLQEVSAITTEEVESHIARLFANVSIRMLLLGNLYKDQTIALSKDVEHILRSKPLLSIPTDLSLILPERCNYAWAAPVPNPNEPNSALSYYLYLGQLTDPRSRVVGLLLVQIMSEPAFNALRTKEQLGYIVSCSRWNLPGDSQFGLRILVQSERGSSYLEERVEAFLDSMDQKIREIGFEEFHDFKSSLQQKWKEPAKNLAEETSRYWLQIDTGYLDFLRGYEDADLLVEVVKQEVLDLFRERVHPLAKRRAKLSIHLQSQKSRAPRVSTEAMKVFETHLQGANVIIDIAAAREELDEANPTATDFINTWREILTENRVPDTDAQALIEQIPALIEQYPVPGEGTNGLPVGVTRIGELNVFKAALQISDPPKPLVKWDDLPMSNL